SRAPRSPIVGTAGGVRSADPNTAPLRRRSRRRRRCATATPDTETDLPWAVVRRGAAFASTVPPWLGRPPPAARRSPPAPAGVGFPTVPARRDTARRWEGPAATPGRPSS